MFTCSFSMRGEFFSLALGGGWGGIVVFLDRKSCRPEHISNLMKKHHLTPLSANVNTIPNNMLRAAVSVHWYKLLSLA